MTETIDGTAVEETGTDLVVREQSTPTLFGTNDPAEVIARAVAAAQPLSDVVRRQNLTTNIQGKEHVRVEGWTLLGSMLGVFPVCVWTRKLDNGWEARVEARTRTGDIVGAAEAECLRDESTWANRDDYALRSMAQTRATSKAMRAPLGFVMQLAGFEATPAEEMPTTGAADVAVFDGDPAEWKFTSGKHAGKTLAETDRGYIEWYAENGPKADVKKICRDYLNPSDGGHSDADDVPF